VESRFVHPSLTAIQEFAHDSKEGLVFRQRPLHEELLPCQQFCLMVLFDAMLAFNTLLVGSPWTAVLMEVASNHDLPTHLPVRNPRP
jgi:hypothetical protein